MGKNWILSKCSWLVFLLIPGIFTSCNLEKRSVNKKIVSYVQNQQYEEGLIYAEGEGELMKDNADYQFYIGVFNHHLGNYDIALRQYSLAEEMNVKPKYVVPVMKARTYAKLGQETESIEQIKKFKKIGKATYTVLENPDFQQMNESNIEFRMLKYDLKPGFNIWTSFFIFVVIQAFIVAVILFRSPNAQNDANKLLSILISYFGLSIVSYIIYWTGFSRSFPYFNYYPQLMAYISGPLFYLYVRNILQDRQVKKRDILHFIPSIIAFMAILPLLLNVYFPALNVHLSYEINPIILHPIGKAAILTAYGFLSYRLMIKSGKEKRNVTHWLQVLLVAFAGYIISFISYYILVNFEFFNPNWDYMISFTQGIFIFVVGYLGHLQPRVVQGEKISEIIQPKKYDQINISDQAEQQLISKLTSAMREDKLFLENDLNLNSLADYVESNRHHVSMIINKHFDMNFNDYVNQFRVERLKEVILDKENQNYTLIHLAYECGFNNKVSFNKAFKKFTGLTPTEHIRKHRRKTKVN